MLIILEFSKPNPTSRIWEVSSAMVPLKKTDFLPFFFIGDKDVTALWILVLAFASSTLSILSISSNVRFRKYNAYSQKQFTLLYSLYSGIKDTLGL